jgi:hypothetical protein
MNTSFSASQTTHTSSYIQKGMKSKWFPLRVLANKMVRKYIGLVFLFILAALRTQAQCPTMTSPSSITICSGESVNLSLTANQAGTTFSWVAIDNPNVTGESLTNQGGAIINNVLTNNSTVNQTVTYTVTPTANSCTGSPQTVTVTINPEGVVNAGNDQTICAGSTATMNGTVGLPGSSGTCTNPVTSINVCNANKAYQGVAQVGATIRLYNAFGQLQNPTGGTQWNAATSTITAVATPSALAPTTNNFLWKCNEVGTSTSCGAGGAPCLSDGNYYTTAQLPGQCESIPTWFCIGLTGTTSVPSITSTITPSSTSVSGNLAGNIANNNNVNVYLYVNGTQVGFDTTTTNTGSWTINVPANTFEPCDPVYVIAARNITTKLCPSQSATTIISCGTWTSSGTGTFNNANEINAIYTPSAADIASGSVVITLTTNDPTGPCPAVNDAMTLTINPAVVVNAGPDQNVCASTSSAITLAGSITGGSTTGTWTSSGTGSFANPNVLNTTYTPTAADIASGAVTLTLTSADPSGPCPSLTDVVTINLFPTPTVNAGVDLTICAGSNATMNGTVGLPASSGTWTSSGTGTFNVANDLAAIYTPSPIDISNGSVIITLTTNDPTGPCPAVNDAMSLTINPAVVVNAGPDQNVCASTTSAITLAGSITGGSTTGTWTSSGTGSFANPNVLNTTYTPTAADIASGAVILTLTSADPSGPCPSLTDAVTINLFPTPAVNAGLDQNICNGDSVLLSGSGATIYQWDNNVLNGIAFSPQSTQTYTVTGTDNNNCSATDQVIVTVSNPTFSVQSETAIDSFFWSVNGQTYTQSGSYTQVLTNVGGCDSTITLDLSLSYAGIGENEIRPLGKPIKIIDLNGKEIPFRKNTVMLFIYEDGTIERVFILE